MSDLQIELRQLFNKAAEAFDGDYPDKVDYGLMAVYAYARRKTLASASVLKSEDLSAARATVAELTKVLRECFYVLSGDELSKSSLVSALKNARALIAKLDAGHD